MSTLPQRFISLCLISGLAIISATPAQAQESKASQCKRLDQALMAYAKSIEFTPPKNQDPIVWMDQRLAKSEAEINRLKSRKFSDPKIRQFHRGAVNFSVDIHNHFIALTNAAEVGDRAGIQRTQRSFHAMLNSAAVKQLDREIQAYCGTSTRSK
jgi:hypothetical protein